MCRGMWTRSGSIHVTYKVGELVRYSPFSEKGMSRKVSVVTTANAQVTERLRRPLEQDQRKFKTIIDITDQIPRYGQYNHRGEMGEVKRLMELWGVGEDFSAVVMNSS